MCNEFTHWILSAVAERFTVDLPQVNSFACFCDLILLTSNSIIMAILVCVSFCWALPRSFVVLLLDLRRNANLAGGFAGRCGCFPFLVCFVVNGFAILGPFWVLFTQIFTAYAIVRTESSAFSGMLCSRAWTCLPCPENESYARSSLREGRITAADQD